MAKCPKCGEKIQTLRCVQDVLISRPFNKKGIYDDRKMEELGRDCEVISYKCPCCFEEVTDSEEEAIEFLNQK